MENIWKNILDRKKSKDRYLGEDTNTIFEEQEEVIVAGVSSDKENVRGGQKDR